jgi:hypothetical protein
VNFILEVSGVPVGGPGVVPAGSVTVNSATSITAISPAVIAGTTYYVTVNTAGGTSAYSSSDVYTYATLTPTVLALTVATGPASGGTSTVLTGAGFFTGAVVDFVEESNGTASTPSVILASPSVTVTNSTTLTAITPAITTGSTYFVSVTTTGGTSTYGPIFSFVSTAPTVSVISPTSGPTTGGTTITLTGSGFFTGAEVFVIKETGGSPVAPPTVLAATNVNVNVLTGTSLTATTPAISSGTTYFVVVVTSYGESSYGPVFTY